jgi:MoaA/NifB/PqqE/SkfB family radical SAM enzyme
VSKPRIQLWYELETRCNLCCRYCLSFWKDQVLAPPRSLAPPATLQALESLFEVVDCESITISGGEPLLREDLQDILFAIRERGIPTVLATNATLLDYPHVSEFMDLGVVTFQIPLHSTDSVMHDALCGVGSWRSSLNALRILKESGATVVPVFVATRLNLEQFAAVMEMCSLLGVTDIVFNRLVPSGLALRNREALGVPGDEDVVAALVKANDSARQLDVRVRLGVPVTLDSNCRRSLDRISFASCPVGPGQRRWTLDAAGDIRRCNHSGVAFADLSPGGIEKWVAELSGAQPAEMTGAIRPCRLLLE